MSQDLLKEDRKYQELCGSDCFWEGHGWYEDAEGNRTNPREDKRCWLWNLLRQLTMGGTEYYDQQRAASIPRLRYWAFTTRRPENQHFGKGSPGGQYFSSTIGKNLAEKAVTFGVNKVSESQEFVDILKEWHLNPPYITFWAEVQEAYMYFLTRPRDQGGYKGIDEAKTLADELIAKASEYEGRRVTEGTSQNSVESQSSKLIQGETIMTALKGTKQPIELPNSDFMSLFGVSIDSSRG